MYLKKKYLLLIGVLLSRSSIYSTQILNIEETQNTFNQKAYGKAKTIANLKKKTWLELIHENVKKHSKEISLVVISWATLTTLIIVFSNNSKSNNNPSSSPINEKEKKSPTDKNGNPSSFTEKKQIIKEFIDTINGDPIFTTMKNKTKITQPIAWDGFVGVDNNPSIHRVLLKQEGKVVVDWALVTVGDVPLTDSFVTVVQLKQLIPAIKKIFDPMAMNGNSPVQPPMAPPIQPPMPPHQKPVPPAPPLPQPMGQPMAPQIQPPIPQHQNPVPPVQPVPQPMDQPVGQRIGGVAFQVPPAPQQFSTEFQMQHPQKNLNILEFNSAEQLYDKALELSSKKNFNEIRRKIIRIGKKFYTFNDDFVFKRQQDKISLPTTSEEKKTFIEENKYNLLKDFENYKQPIIDELNRIKASITTEESKIIIDLMNFDSLENINKDFSINQYKIEDQFSPDEIALLKKHSENFDNEVKSNNPKVYNDKLIFTNKIGLINKIIANQLGMKIDDTSDEIDIEKMIDHMCGGSLARIFQDQKQKNTAIGLEKKIPILINFIKSAKTLLKYKPNHALFNFRDIGRFSWWIDIFNYLIDPNKYKSLTEKFKITKDHINVMEKFSKNFETVNAFGLESPIKDLSMPYIYFFNIINNIDINHWYKALRVLSN